MADFKSLSPEVRAIDVLDNDTLVVGTAGCEIVMINS